MNPAGARGRRWCRPLRVVGGSVVVALATAGPLVHGPLAAGATPAVAPVDCSAGVIVAVDLGNWNGTVHTVCLSPPPANAAAALQEGGFDPTPVAAYGLAFICQIAGEPAGADCSTTPPANAYWALWYATAGQNSWTYSQVGAMGLEPQPGSVEAWVFGGSSAGSPPAMPTPDQLRAATTSEVGGSAPTSPSTPPPAATPAPASTPPPTGASRQPAAPVTPTTPSTAATHAASGASPPASPSRGRASPGGGGPASSSSGPGSTNPTPGHSSPSNGVRHGLAIVSGAPAAATRPSTGSPVALLVGLAAAALLLTAAALTVRARRRQGEEP